MSHRKAFKMLCNSFKCAGISASKGVVKIENMFLRDCPDCGSAMKQDFGGNGKIKDKKPNYNPDAPHGLKTRDKGHL